MSMENYRGENKSKLVEIEDAKIISEGSGPIGSSERSGVNENDQENPDKTQEASSEKESSLEIEAEKLDNPEQEFIDAEGRFKAIKDTAEKLKSAVPELAPEIYSNINSANKAIGAFNNIRESDERTRENLISKYLNALNRAIKSINELIEENKDKLEIQGDQDQIEEEKVEGDNDGKSENSKERSSRQKGLVEAYVNKFNKIFTKKFGNLDTLDNTHHGNPNGLPEYLIDAIKAFKAKEAEVKKWIANTDSATQNSEAGVQTLRNFVDELRDLKHATHEAHTKYTREKLDLDNPKESEDLEAKKSEIISGFSSVEPKFEEIVSNAKSVVINEDFQKLKPDVRRVIEVGRNAIKEFNELAKTEPTEENLNQLEGKKRELESVIASLAKKIGEMERVESDDEGSEKKDVVSEEVAGKEDDEEDDKIPTLTEEVKLENDTTRTKNNGGVVDVEEKREEEISTKSEDGVVDVDKGVVEGLELDEGEKIEAGTKEEKDNKEIFQAERKEWYEARKKYYEDKNAYNGAVESFYKNRNWFGKMADSTKSFFGLKLKLPEEITKLENEFKKSRSSYARGLDSVLKKRAIEKNINYAGLNEKDSEGTSTKASDKIKQLFTRKFVLRPSKEKLDLQKTEILTEGQSETIKRVMTKLKENKWYVRGLIVAGATVAGTVTGGALAAGFTAGALAGSRMAVGAGAGMTAGFLADKGMSFRVNKAEARSKELMEGGNFSMADIDNYEEEVMQALRKAKAAQSQRTAAIATAGFAGGLAGAYNAPDSWVEGAGVAEKVSNGSDSVVGDDVSSEEITENIKKAMEISGFKEEVSGDTIGTETDTEVAEDAEKVAEAEKSIEPLTGESREVIDKLNIPIYNVGEVGQFHNFVENISITGAEGLEAEQLSQVKQFIQLKANDILSGEPHMTSEKLGTELQSSLEKRFGEESWWEESPIGKVDIGNITKVGYDSYVDVDNLNKSSEENGSYDWTKDNKVVEAWREQAGTGTEMAQSVEVPDNIYEVQPGDKLWTIMKDQYADILDKVPESEHNQILAQLFNNVNTNPELLESLNLKSGDNIHLIYPDEKINIGPLGEELKRIIELGNVDDLPTKGATGSLGVEADGPAEKVSINFAKDGVDNPFVTEDTAPTSIAEKNTNSAESAGSGKEVMQFAVKAGTPTELTLKMNEFVQQTANKILEQNPNIDATSFKNAVWQAFTNEFKAELNGSNQMILAFEPKPEAFASQATNNIPPPPPGNPVGGVPPDFAGQAPSAQEIPPGYVEMTPEVPNNGIGTERINMATSIEDPTLNQMRAEVFQNPDKFEKAVQEFVKAQEDRSIFDFNDSVFETVGNTMTVFDLDRVVQMGKADALAYLEQNNLDISYEELKGWGDYVRSVAYDPVNNPNGLLVTESTTLGNLVERDVLISTWIEQRDGSASNANVA